MATKMDVAMLQKIWESQDEAYGLMMEYDSLPHRYGAYTLHQAEAHVITLIAENPDITVTDISCILKKTPSACSQMIRKLREKGWVAQFRNENNNREYKLRITEEGEKVYLDHDSFDRECKARTFRKLEDFTKEQLNTYLEIQNKLIEAYAEDVKRSREYFG